MNISVQPNALHMVIDGIGVIGPGFSDWENTRRLLAADEDPPQSPTILTAPALLPPAERRRTGKGIKLAIGVGLQAAAAAGADPKTLATVFTASSGDGDNCSTICESLASDDRLISPTRFHNSVHNAPAGYWSIATGAMSTSTALCAYDASFAAGLLEAACLVVTRQIPVLLIAYDVSYPEPLASKRPHGEPLGVALLLAPRAASRSLATLKLSLGEGEATPMARSGLETLRSSAPAARALPLLEMLARGQSGTLALEYLAPAVLQIELAGR